ncbi:diguanylate cyclase [Paraburkholderia rhizosphaerae]|uniref:diguanylate cyclase n=1 Tax=Paraburkholderia rhizosphaerae TaxID=480658 RepID=A0A4R8L7M1_9BURK|nr:diguanylate cyclase [Paraburkholderia rhizosphaerae]TDY38727.1 diguanylate cyclase [Paraburkholderia rhizosphaerae]
MASETDRTTDRPADLPAGSGKRFVERLYRLRIVGFGLGFLCVASVLLGQQRGIALWALAVFHGFIWPHVARRAALACVVPYRGERLNLMVDSLFGGFWIVVMQFNVLPSVVILVMLSMDNVAAGGVRLFVRGIGAHAAGIALGVLVMGVTFTPMSTMTTIVACLPLLIIYPIALGWAMYRISQKLAARTREFEHLSRTDGLTRLWNRRHWEGQLAREFDRCRANGYASCLLLIDLDHFKRINDTLGHPAGDAVLIAFADLLRRHFRSGDSIGRYGGEEFGVVLPGATLRETQAVATELLLRVREQAHEPGASCPCTVSAGIAQLTPDMPDYHRWLLEADRSLYQAKAQGRDRIVVAASTTSVPAAGAKL